MRTCMPVSCRHLPRLLRYNTHLTTIMARDIQGYLSKKKAEAPNEDVSRIWAELEDLHSKRLWHQLTQKLLTFVHQDLFLKGGLIDFYDNFLADFEHKINPLSLVEIMLVIIREYSDPDDTLKCLEKTKEKVKNSVEATVLCLTTIGTVKLSLRLLNDVKVIIEDVDKLLDTAGGITPVHARYYDLCSNYHRFVLNDFRLYVTHRRTTICSDHASYYRDALRYLGCMEINDISGLERVDRAFSLALAALLGNDVYNFGELLAHPILESLRNTDKEWLIALLYAFNSGNIMEYEKLRPFWQTQPDLAQNEVKLMNKIRLLALMELVFKRHAHDRTIQFSVIAEAAQIQLSQVEVLIMKALSSGLVKGTIDEVNQEINMIWVQPRVLDLNQVANLKSRMDDWCVHIKHTINLVKDEVPDVLIAQ